MTTTEFTLAGPPTGQERLEQALERLVSRYGFTRIQAEDALPDEGTVLMLLTDDPLRCPEVLDAAVILPEALKGLQPVPVRLVADPAASLVLGAPYGAPRCPAVVFLRDGAYLGSLTGIRDWVEYRAAVEGLLRGPVQPRPLVIPVVAVGACL